MLEKLVGAAIQAVERQLRSGIRIRIKLPEYIEIELSLPKNDKPNEINDGP